MRTLTAVLIAAASAAAVAGLALAAQPPAAGPHTMTVRLPDGGVATITYSGAVPPRIEIGPDAAMAPAAFFAPPTFASGFWPVVGGDPGAIDAAESPLAMMQRMSAAMDRQAAAMFAQAAAAQNSMQHALLRGGRSGGAFSPDGAFSFAATGPGGGYCMRRVEITSNGAGAAPTVVRHSAGQCGGGAGAIGAGASGRAITTSLPRAEPVPTPSAPDPRLYRTEWRGEAPAAAHPRLADATLRTVSDAY